LLLFCQEKLLQAEFAKLIAQLVRREAILHFEFISSVSPQLHISYVGLQLQFYNTLG
jgi:hypothetical protein